MYQFNRCHSCITMKITALLLLMLCHTALKAEGALPPPQQIIQDTSDQLNSILQKENIKNNLKRAREIVETVIEPHVDFNRFSALVLGKHWRKANDTQRSQFKKEFKALLIRTYAAAYSDFSDWNVRFLPSNIDLNQKKVVVRTEIKQDGKPPLSISYRMINKNGVWKVYDLITGGISLVKNYRTTFNNQIAKNKSIDSFLQQLEDRNRKANTDS